MLFAKNNSRHCSLKRQISQIKGQDNIAIQISQKSNGKVMKNINTTLRKKYGRKFTIVSEKQKADQKTKDKVFPAKISKMEECKSKVLYHSQKKQQGKQTSNRHFKRNTWNSTTPIEIIKPEKPFSELFKQNISKRHTIIDQFTFNIRTNFKTTPQFDLCNRNLQHEASGDGLYSKLKKISCLNKLQKITLYNEKHSLVNLIKKFKFENLKNQKIFEQNHVEKAFTDSLQISFAHVQQKRDSARWFMLGKQDNRSYNKSNLQNSRKTNKTILKKTFQHTTQQNFNLKTQHNNHEDKTNVSPWATTNDFYLNHDNINL